MIAGSKRPAEEEDVSTCSGAVLGFTLIREIFPPRLYYFVGHCFTVNGADVNKQSERSVVGDEGKVEKTIHVSFLFCFCFWFFVSLAV